MESPVLGRTSKKEQNSKKGKKEMEYQPDTKDCISYNRNIGCHYRSSDLSSRTSRNSHLQLLRKPFKSRKDVEEMNHDWKTFKDPKSGRMYYYNFVTKETQWRKPVELTSSAERIKISEKDQKQRNFFAAMENNILKCLAQGSIPGTTPKDNIPDSFGRERKGTLCSRPSSIGIRTISAMNDNILEELVRIDSSSPTNVIDISDPDSLFVRYKCVSPSSSRFEKEMFNDIDNTFLEQWVQNGTTPSEENRTDSKIETEFFAGKESKEFAAHNQFTRPIFPNTKSFTNVVGNQTQVEEKLNKPSLGRRRNTCGTMYVGETMSAPDKEATIKCVCAVYRAHILQCLRDEENNDFSTHSEEYDIFNDFKIIPSLPVNEGGAKPITIMDREYSDDSLFSRSFPSLYDVPTLDEITFFYRSVFLTSKMESDCIIISLIYVEKIIRATNNGVRPAIDNWRSLLFSSMILASKVWDDLSMWNVDFTEACPRGVTFSLQRINELEMAVLNCLNFDVKVRASEYAKYYFLLRSMLIQSDLGGDDFFASGPLDLEGAQKLENISSNYQQKKSKHPILNRRAKSMGETIDEKNLQIGGDTRGKSNLSNRVVLENVVQM